jgi:hypothetical protein
MNSQHSDSLLPSFSESENLKDKEMIRKVRKNSTPRLREVIGGTKTNTYCQGNICGRCVLAVLQTVKLGVTEVGNQIKPRKYSEKKLHFAPI